MDTLEPDEVPSPEAIAAYDRVAPPLMARLLTRGMFQFAGPLSYIRSAAWAREDALEPRSWVESLAQPGFAIAVSFPFFYLHVVVEVATSYDLRPHAAPGLLFLVESDLAQRVIERAGSDDTGRPRWEQVMTPYELLCLAMLRDILPPEPPIIFSPLESEPAPVAIPRGWLPELTEELAMETLAEGHASAELRQWLLLNLGRLP